MYIDSDSLFRVCAVCSISIKCNNMCVNSADTDQTYKSGSICLFWYGNNLQACTYSAANMSLVHEYTVYCLHQVHVAVSVVEQYRNSTGHPGYVSSLLCSTHNLQKFHCYRTLRCNFLIKIHIVSLLQFIMGFIFQRAFWIFRQFLAFLFNCFFKVLNNCLPSLRYFQQVVSCCCILFQSQRFCDILAGATHWRLSG